VKSVEQREVLQVSCRRLVCCGLRGRQTRQLSYGGQRTGRQSLEGGADMTRYINFGSRLGTNRRYHKIPITPMRKKEGKLTGSTAQINLYLQNKSSWTDEYWQSTMFRWPHFTNAWEARKA
jgi:hypothetical protein